MAKNTPGQPSPADNSITRTRLCGAPISVRQEGEGDASRMVVRASFSSDQPYSFGRFSETLTHTEDAVDLSYARSGQIFTALYNHDYDQPIGRVDADSISFGQDDGGRTRIEGDIIFNPNNALAKQLFQDIERGFAGNISIGYGYGADDFTDTKTGDRVDRVVNHWRLVEVSVVTVPADPTIGANRGAKQTPMDNPREDITMDKNDIRLLYSTGRKAGLADDLIDGLVDKYDDAGDANRELMGLIADKVVADKAAQDTADAKRQADQDLVDQAKANDPLQDIPTRGAEPVDVEGMAMVDSLVGDYNVMRVMDRIANGQRIDGFEGEIASLYKSNKRGGITIPYLAFAANTLRDGMSSFSKDVRNDAKGRLDMLRQEVADKVRTTTSDASAILTDVIFTGAFRALLSDRSLVNELGVNFMSATGQGSIPRANAGVTAGWLDSDATTGGPTSSKIGFDEVEFNQKTVAMQADFTRAVQNAPVMDVVGLTLADMRRVFDLEVTKGLVTSPGTGNTPTGILAAATGANGVGTVNFTSALKGRPTYAQMVEFSQTVYGKMKDQAVTGSFLVAPGVYSHLITTPAFGAGTALTLATSAPLGDTALVSGIGAQLRQWTGFAAGTGAGGQTTIIYGDWGQAYVVSFSNGLEVRRDDIASNQAKAGGITIRMYADLDIVFRSLEAFAKNNDA